MSAKPMPLQFHQVKLRDVVVGDLWANGATITESREPTEEEAKWIRKTYPRRKLWHVRCGESWSLTGLPDRYCVVGRPS